MPPVVWLVFIGGAFLLGRVSAKQEQKPSGPLPSIPELPPPDASAEDFTEEWDQIDYPVDVFPPGAEPHVERLLPPPPPDGLSISPGCQTIAVGQDWWAGALEAARVSRFEMSQSVSRTVDSILRSAAPPCRGSSSAAVRAFRVELTSRVRGLEGPERNQLYETTATE